MNILIVGYGNIGKHMYEEFRMLHPDIYDPYIKEYSIKQQKKYDMAFICVPTDKLPDGSCDTSVVERAIGETDADIIVIKSTIPPLTTKRLICESGKNIIFSPEHYGVTQHCKKDPGFVILGGDKAICKRVAEIYGRVKNGSYRIYFTDECTAELTKYMLNSYLALKVTFCNEFADIAGKYGVSYPELRELFVADDRVGSSHTYVYPDKPYYDSHCFNKDVPALVNFTGGIAPLMVKMNEINLKLKEKISHSDEIKATIKAEPVCNTNRTFFNHAVVGNAPDYLKDDLDKDRALKSAAARQSLINEEKSIRFKYNVALCIIIRDENVYLKEWLEWHSAIGVEHFFIYDHGSKEPVKDFIKTLDGSLRNKITVIDWSGAHKDAQPEAYNHCLNSIRGICKWLGYIDVDEQVNIKTGQNIAEFLNGYRDYAGLYAMWVIYNANGHKKKTNEPLRKRFTVVSHGDAWADTVGKLFVQPLFMKEMYIHNGEAKQGFEIVDENKNVISRYILSSDNPTTELISIDHFYTKSYEEWMEKMRRGSAHANFSRRYEEFFALNPDMEDCREDIGISQKYEEFD